MTSTIDPAANEQARTPPWRRTASWLPWLVLLISLLATFLLWRDEQRIARQELQTSFNSRAQDAINRIEQRMAAYEQVLRGVVGMFLLSGNVTRDEFHTYVTALKLEQNYPGFQGLQFVRIVPAAEKGTHVAATRRDGFPQYTITPAGDREIYCPVVYTEPFTALNRLSLGFDTCSEARRRAALEQSRDLDEAVLSGKITLHQNKASAAHRQAGAVMSLPIYQTLAPHDTPTSRRAKFQGWVTATFRMDDLMAGILGSEIPDLDIEVYDGEEISKQALMHDADGIQGDTRLQRLKINAARHIDIGHHVWTVAIYPLPAFEARLDKRKPSFIAMAGVGVSLLLALLTWLLARGRERALQFAADMNLELIQNKELLSELGQADSRLRVAAAAFDIHYALMITDADSRIVRVNQAFEKITGYSESEAIGNTPHMLKSGVHEKEFYAAMWQEILTTGTWSGEISDRHKNGTIYPRQTTITAVKDANGNTIQYVTIFNDIYERKTAEDKIEFLAFHDPLTGLPNRRLVLERLELARAYADRSETKVAVLFLDLDNFKTINDGFGHATGDALLNVVAQRLSECTRDTDIISRQGGDEFLIALTNVSDADTITDTTLKILEKIEKTIHIEGNALSTSVSIGISVYPDDNREIDTLLNLADTAMYFAKESGRNAYRFYTEQMNVDAHEHQHIRVGLRQALELGEFVLHYQPQIDLSSGSVIGAEALIRWNHPEQGLLPPIRFIHVAEESGLIVPMGDWVLQEACRQAVAWQQAGLPDLVVAVNVSAMQFKRGDLEQSVLQALSVSGLAPEFLELELTESILIKDTDKVLETVQRLKAHGLQLSIDDFGTGYSSLSYLKRFEVDKLKIDQSFVRDMVANPNDAVLIRAIIQMARSLNLKTIAEGIEDEHQLSFLRLQYCDEGQGYYFARPMPADEFAQYVLNAKTRGSE